MFETVHLILVVSSLLQAAALCTAAVLRAIGWKLPFVNRRYFLIFSQSRRPHDEAMLLLFGKDWSCTARYMTTYIIGIRKHYNDTQGC